MAGKVRFTAKIEQHQGMDAEPREVAVPDDVKAILSENRIAKEYYDGLAFSHKKEYIAWIESAKKEETRAKRIDIFVEKLNSKKRFMD